MNDARPCPYVFTTPRFNNSITLDSFEFHQDWSLDGGETWVVDILFYRATRTNSDAPDLSN